MKHAIINTRISGDAQDMTQTLIHIKNVTVKLKHETLLKNINWVIRNKQVWAVIGLTGPAKTIIGELITGTRQPDTGRVSYSFTEDGNHTPSRNIIFLSSEAQMEARVNSSPYYQARWNSADKEFSETTRYFVSAQGIFGSSKYHVLSSKEIPANFKYAQTLAIQATGIAPVLTRKIMDLSNGELRKVLIARALAQSPRILIIEDPLAGLDTYARKTFNKIIDTGVKLGVTMILIAPCADDIPKNCITHQLSIRRCTVDYAGPVRRLPARKAHTTILKPSTRQETENKHGAILVKMNNVSIRYGRTRILNNLSWTIKTGEQWALTGPNGSGKTTLLSLILGDNPQAYANDILLFGRKRGSGESIWDIKKYIGHVAPEVQAFLPANDTVLTTVCSGFHDSIGLYNRCPPIQQRIALGWIQKLGLGTTANKPLCEISVSDQRIVLLARALVKAPRLLILDELCQGFDRMIRNHVLELLDNLVRKTKTTIIYVTHQPAEMPGCITNILSLKQGRALIR